MKHYLKLMRVHHYIKNFLVFAALACSGQLFNLEKLKTGIAAFISFCMISSVVYIINDICDVEKDRRHPTKCKRPIASGHVTIRQAWVLTFLLVLMAALLLLTLPERAWMVLGVVGSYYVLNIGYCCWLKNHAIIDVCTIAFGFVLRILAGGVATDIFVSRWLVLISFLLTLFLSLAKRRDDVLRMNATGTAPRRNTIRYNLTFINQAITITASVTLVCYIMYCVSPEVVAAFNTPHLYLTTIFVIIGLLRYIQLAVVDEQTGDPTKVIWNDRFTQLVVLGWGLTFLILIYL